MSTPLTTFYAGGFVYDAAAHAVLLHLRDGNTKANPNMWAIFGGTSEQDETPLQCFLREFEEETGQRLPSDSCAALRDYFNESAQTQRHVFYSTASLDTKDIRLTEGAGFGWLRLDHLDRHPLTEMTRSDLTFFGDLIANQPHATLSSRV
jgi:8-oxo-dGTP diphosphatase